MNLFDAGFPNCPSGDIPSHLSRLAADKIIA
jgi:hypothetical protein